MESGRKSFIGLARDLSLDTALAEMEKAIGPEITAVIDAENLLSNFMDDYSFMNLMELTDTGPSVTKKAINEARISNMVPKLVEEYMLDTETAAELSKRVIGYDDDLLQIFGKFEASNSLNFPMFLEGHLFADKGLERYASLGESSRLYTNLRGSDVANQANEIAKSSGLTVTDKDRVKSSSKTAKNIGKLGAWAGLATAVPLVFQGKAAEAVEAAIPFGASAVAAVEGRPLEASLLGIEETGIGLAFTEAGRPILSSLGYDVDDGLIQSLLSSEPGFEDIQEHVGYVALQSAYGNNLNTIQKHESFRLASDRLIEIDETSDPTIRHQNLDVFLTAARTEIQSQMHRFVESHLTDFQELGYGLSDDGMPMALENAVSSIVTALTDKSKDGGYQTINIEADAFLRQDLYRTYLPLERSLAEITQYQGYLRLEAINRGFYNDEDTAPVVVTTSELDLAQLNP